MGQLGQSTTTVSVGGPTGMDQPDGMLVLQGGTTGMTVNRNLDFAGFGGGQVNSGILAFESIGNNTINGSRGTLDTLLGGLGNDSIAANSSDSVLGGGGADTITGQ